MTAERRLDFVPLGGTGEIGMNLNLYRTRGRWLMVDAGVLFRRTPGGGLRILVPEIGFIEARRERLDGLVLTHAHQDHLGAVAALWPRLRCTVYATPFAAAMLEGPLAEAGLRDQVPIRVLHPQARFRVGPFDLQRVPLTHSTVEMGALVIRTEASTVLHTGDWKLDADPVVGPSYDPAALQRLAKEGIDVCVSDSTNADVPGWTPSEGTLFEPLRQEIARRSGRVAVTLFSSNIARMQTLARVAQATQRELVFAGRSIERTFQAAQKAGYLLDVPPVVPLRHYGYLPPERVLLLCTGSQGELRAALSRIATDQHPAYLAEGDAVLFSARQIPGNELEILRLTTLLRAKGVDIVTADDATIHVSGHPCQDELRQLYRWVAPRWVLPVHGTPPKLEAHAALVERMGIGALRVRNGQIVELGPKPGSRHGVALTGRVERPEPPPRATSHRVRRGS